VQYITQKPRADSHTLPVTIDAMRSVEDLLKPREFLCKIKGMDIQIEAQANANLKGTAGVKVEASGTVDVKGAMINLN